MDLDDVLLLVYIIYIVANNIGDNRRPGRRMSRCALRGCSSARAGLARGLVGIDLDILSGTSGSRSRTIERPAQVAVQSLKPLGLFDGSQYRLGLHQQHERVALGSRFHDLHPQHHTMVTLARI